MNEWMKDKQRSLLSLIWPFLFLVKKKNSFIHLKKKVVIFPRDLIYFPLLIVSIPFFFFSFWRIFSPMFWFPRLKWYRRRRRRFSAWSSRQAYLRLVVAFAGFKQQQTDRTTRNISSFFLSFYSTTVTVAVYVAVVIVLELAKRHFFFFSGAGGVKREREKGLTLGYRSPDRSHWSYCKCALLLLLLQFPTTDDEKRMGIWERWLAADVHWELGERNVSCSLKGD